MKLRKLAVLGAALAVLTSCAGPQYELKDFLGARTGEVDFEGLTFRIVDSGSAGGSTRLMKDETIVPSARSELLFARYDEIEEEYNCTIEVLAYDEDTLMVRQAGGVPYADLINHRLHTIWQHYQNGYIMPLNEISTIDLYSGKYGSEQLLEDLTWKGDTVAAYPQYWGIITSNFSDALFFNPYVFSMINIPTPHELYEQGEWNWDALERIGKACLSTSTADYPLYLSTMNNYFVRMMVCSNGGEYLSRNSEGKYSYALLEPEVMEAVQEANRYFNEGYLMEYPDDVQDALKLFVDEKLAIIAEYSVQGIFDDKGVIGTDMQGEYGWAFNPIGPKGSADETGMISDENMYIFATIEKEIESDALGDFIELLFEPLGDEPMDWVETFLGTNFYESTSEEVFMSKFENTKFDPVFFAYQEDEMYDILLEAAETGAIREKLESLQSQANALLDEGINAE